MANQGLNAVLHHLRRICAAETNRDLLDSDLLERFVEGKEEAAFALLVQRHGPMVLGICNRVLGDHHAAEDAFQATFLVLVRRAASLSSGSLAGWLYGVAQRVALHARTRNRMQRNREKQVPAKRLTDALDEPSWQELRTVLDEEIAALPERLRAPVVLCYVEGKSHAEAGRALGWPKTSLTSRLMRARDQLRVRLARRGIALSATALTVGLAERAGGAALPAGLTLNTVKEAVLFAAGKSTAGVLAARSLAEESLKGMLGLKAKVIAVLLATGLVSGGLGLGAFTSAEPQASPGPQVGGQRAPKSLARKDAQANPADKEEATQPAADYAGRVIGPDGRPVAGAKLYVNASYWRQPPWSPREYATTGPDGHFKFSASKEEHRVIVTAAAPPYGPAWLEVAPDAPKEALTLQLVKDDVPIAGRIVDLQGKPIQGVSLTVWQINAAPGEDIGPWIQAARAKKAQRFALQNKFLPRYTISLSPKATTDRDGRLRLTGVGSNRVVEALLEGPGITSQMLHILTRSEDSIQVNVMKGGPEYGVPRSDITYYGADFVHAAAPTRPIIGVVRDKESKTPLAHFAIRAEKLADNALHYWDGQELARTTTDARGRYRLTGMPRGMGNKIEIVPPADIPYLPTSVAVPDSAGLDPVTVDIELKRGIWIEGTITDKLTGEPVQASVSYFPGQDNPHRRDYPGVSGLAFHPADGKNDGSYRVVGMPGPGLVGVWPPHGVFLRVPDREDEYGTKNHAVDPRAYAIGMPVENFTALAPLDAPGGARSAQRDATVVPGWRCTGTVLGPDSKPLAGSRSFGLTDGWHWSEAPMQTAEFTTMFYPGRPAEYFFYHRGKGLVGVASVPNKDGASVKVQMTPGAAIAGRLVNSTGKPESNRELELLFHPKMFGHSLVYPHERIVTDRDGRFRVNRLVPGCKFQLSARYCTLTVGGDALHAGKLTDLGDVQLKPDDEYTK